MMQVFGIPATMAYSIPATIVFRFIQFNTSSNTETHASKNPTSLSIHCTKSEFENRFLNQSLTLLKTVADTFCAIDRPLPVAILAPTASLAQSSLIATLNEIVLRFCPHPYSTKKLYQYRFSSTLTLSMSFNLIFRHSSPTTSKLPILDLDFGWD